MAGSPDLFVVCKNCRAEVSPYITECPYCGHRLRKRAPKLEKGAVPKAPKQRRQVPSLGRLRPGEMPGVRADGRPVATMAIVLVSAILTLAALVSDSAANSLVYVETLNEDWWKAFTTTLVYPAGDFGGTAYELITLSAIFLFGWLLERRHGHWAPLLVFVAGTVAGSVATIALPGAVVFMGGLAGALALLGAWVVRDLLALRRGDEVDSDLLGVAAIAIVLALMPAALALADPTAGVVGALVGLLFGLVFARLPQR